MWRVETHPLDWAVVLRTPAALPYPLEMAEFLSAADLVNRASESKAWILTVMGSSNPLEVVGRFPGETMVKEASGI